MAPATTNVLTFAKQLFLLLQPQALPACGDLAPDSILHAVGDASLAGGGPVFRDAMPAWQLPFDP